MGLFDDVLNKYYDGENYWYYVGSELEISNEKPPHWDSKYKCLIEYKLNNSIYGRIFSALKDQKAKKAYKTDKLLGCTLKQYKEYLESKFTDGMNWSNYGPRGWHIDHIRPCASFNLKSKKDQIECFNYINTQPLWATDNLMKNSKTNWVKDKNIDDIDLSIESKLEKQIGFMNDCIDRIESEKNEMYDLLYYLKDEVGIKDKKLLDFFK